MDLYNIKEYKIRIKDIEGHNKGTTLILYGLLTIIGSVYSYWLCISCVWSVSGLVWLRFSPSSATIAFPNAALVYTLLFPFF